MSNVSVAYYPGCCGEGTSLEYELSTRRVCEKLGIQLNELDDWNCCGSTPAHTVNHELAAAIAGRNLNITSQAGHTTLATPCPSCLMSLRTASHRVRNDEFRSKVEHLMGEECPTNVDVKTVLQIMVEDYGIDEVAKHVTRPVKGLKVTCYYGCIMNRPPGLMQFDDPENPMAIDNLMDVIGADVVDFPHKVECCGAVSGIPRHNIFTQLSGKLLDAAAETGADAIVTACPLCQMNLDLRQGQVNRANGTKHKIPVFYYTQLMGLAMGLSSKDMHIAKQIVDPKPCLIRAGLI